MPYSFLATSSDTLVPSSNARVHFVHLCPTVLLGDFVNRVPCSLHDLLRWRHHEYFVGTTFSEGERPRVASCTSSDALVPSSDALASACVWFWGCAWVPSPKTWPALTPWIGTVCGNVWICVAASLYIFAGFVRRWCVLAPLQLSSRCTSFNR